MKRNFPEWLEDNGLIFEEDDIEKYWKILQNNLLNEAFSRQFVRERWNELSIEGLHDSLKKKLRKWAFQEEEQFTDEEIVLSPNDIVSPNDNSVSNEMEFPSIQPELPFENTKTQIKRIFNFPKEVNWNSTEFVAMRKVIEIGNETHYKTLINLCISSKTLLQMLDLIDSEVFENYILHRQKAFAVRYQNFSLLHPKKKMLHFPATNPYQDFFQTFKPKCEEFRKFLMSELKLNDDLLNTLRKGVRPKSIDDTAIRQLGKTYQVGWNIIMTSHDNEYWPLMQKLKPNQFALLSKGQKLLDYGPPKSNKQNKNLF